MIKKCFLIMILFFSNLAFCKTDPRAKRICLEYSYSDKQLECLLDIKDVVFDDNIFYICPNYSYTEEKHRCLLNLGNATYSPYAARICLKHSYTDQQEKCFFSFKDEYIHSDAYDICINYSYPEKQEKCLINLKNLTFEKELTDICKSYSHIEEVEECMKKLGSPYEEESSFLGDLIISKINSALRSIEEENIARAKTILQKLKSFIFEHEGEPL